MAQAEKKIKVGDFKGVPSTLFLILWAQYLESTSPKGIIKDNKVIEIVDSLDYDFSKYHVSSNDSLGVAIRKKIIDKEIQKFIFTNPDGIVVNLGCGLDTHYEFFKQSNVIWYDLDLPSVITLRNHFFPETENHKLIGKSVMDFTWMQEIPKNKKVLILAEGLLPYFLDHEVKALLVHIENQFPKSEILIHAISPWRLRIIHKDLKKRSLKLGWGITSGKEIEKLANLTFQNEWFVFEQYPNKWSWFFKILNLFPFIIKQEKIIHLVNREDHSDPTLLFSNQKL